MSKITPVTVWQVEGFSKLFSTEAEAKDNLLTRDLADNIQRQSTLSEDDAWNLAVQLRAEYLMVPKHALISECLNQSDSLECTVGQLQSFVEYLQNAY